MREPLAVDDEPTLVSPAADVAAIGREEAAALYTQLARLPAKQREAVVLRDLYGLRYDEVAKALGTSRPAVEALLFRGRQQLQRRLRPGVAAGVLVVPLAVQESIAYAIPGFASTAAPAGAAAAAVGIPLVAKLATAGAAVALAGSAGVVAERSLHDPPARPAEANIEQVEPAAAAPSSPALPIPPGGFPIVSRSHDDDSSGPSSGDDEVPRAAGEADDVEDEAEENEGLDNRGKGTADDEEPEAVREDKSGPGGGDAHDADDDRSGPGDGAEPAEADADSGSGGDDEAELESGEPSD